MKRSIFSGIALAAFALGSATGHAQTTTSTLPDAVVTAQNQVISDLASLKAALTQFQTDNPGSTANQPELPQSSMKSRNLPPEI